QGSDLADEPGRLPLDRCRRIVGGHAPDEGRRRLRRGARLSLADHRDCWRAGIAAAPTLLILRHRHHIVAAATWWRWPLDIHAFNIAWPPRSGGPRRTAVSRRHQVVDGKAV